MKFTVYSALIFATLLFTTATSHAESFRWIDDQGKVRIGIKPVAEPIEMDEGDEDEGDVTEEVSASPMPVPAKVINKPKPVVVPQAVAPVSKPAPAPVIAAPKPIAPVKAPARAQAPKTIQKPIVKKPAIVKKKAPVKKPIAKKAPAKKPIAKKKPNVKPRQASKSKTTAKPKKVAKPKKAAPAKQKAATAKSNSNREDMCGVFTGYVHDYEDKVKNCSKNLCAIYQRSLDRYKKKQKSYCGK